MPLQGSTPEERVKGLDLPELHAPAGAYTMIVPVGDLLYISGQLPFRKDGSLHTGSLESADTDGLQYSGKVLSVAQGNEAARDCGLVFLSVLKKHLGSLDKVVRIVKLTGFVNAKQGFANSPQVINGFSEMMIDVFGEAGRSARSAIGLSALPFNAAVEVEGIVQVKPDSKI